MHELTRATRALPPFITAQYSFMSKIDSNSCFIWTVSVSRVNFCGSDDRILLLTGADPFLVTSRLDQYSKW